MSSTTLKKLIPRKSAAAPPNETGKYQTNKIKQINNWIKSREIK